jgi:hypothetical protein
MLILQPLFWSKLPAQSVANTIWSDPNSTSLELDLQDLPTILSATVAPDVAAKPKARTNALTSLLDLSESLPTFCRSRCTDV